MLPLVPIIAGLAALCGSGTLVWYYNLSDADKRQADQLAAEYAFEHFGKTLDQLDREEATHVSAMTRRHFD